MTPIESLPFHLRVPGEDVVDLQGARSVSYRVEGLLHFVGATLTLEWAGTRTTQRASLTRMGTEVEPLPLELLEVPASWLAEVRLRGGWWLPRLELRARRLDAFDALPAARPGVASLRVRRRHLALARAMAAAIEAARAEALLAPEATLRQLGRSGDSH